MSLAIACASVDPNAEHAAGGSAGAAGLGGSAAASGGGSAGSSVAGAGAGGTGGLAGGSAAGAGGVTQGGGAPGQSVGTITATTATWKGGATAAYSIIHDDLCDASADSLFNTAEPELTSRGLRAGFGAIVAKCEERALWPKVQAVKDSEHEIINHSWSHVHLTSGPPDLTTDPSVDLNQEIDVATATLDAKLTGQKTSYFIFPFDEFNADLLTRLTGLGYIGARAGERGMNDANFADPIRNRFDVWGASLYGEGAHILQQYVDEVIQNGAWGIREFHAVGTDAWKPVGVDEYKAHLDYVKSKADAGQLWMDTPSTVVSYRFAREYCGAPTPGQDTLTFPGGANCAKYATELSVKIGTAIDVTTLFVRQAGVDLITKKLGPNQFTVDIDPTKGTAYIGGT